MTPQDEEQELLRIEAKLRAIDPGRKAATALSERGRKRVLWSARHPFLAWCMLHHTAIATAFTAAALVALFLWLRFENRRVAEESKLPDTVSRPVLLLPAPPVQESMP